MSQLPRYAPAACPSKGPCLRINRKTAGLSRHRTTRRAPARRRPGPAPIVVCSRRRVGRPRSRFPRRRRRGLHDGVAMNAPRSCCSERRRRAGLGRRTGASGRRAVSHTARKVQAGESRIGADASEDVREGASFAAQGPQRSWRASSALLAEVVLLATAAAMAIQCERSAKQWQSAFQTVSLLDKCRLLARFLRASRCIDDCQTKQVLTRLEFEKEPVLYRSEDSSSGLCAFHTRRCGGARHSKRGTWRPAIAAPCPQECPRGATRCPKRLVSTALERLIAPCSRHTAGRLPAIIAIRANR